MHVTYRSYLTAGVAALGAGAIALTPVQVIPNQLAVGQERTISNLAVSLAAQIDPVQAWKDTLSLAQSNIAQVQAYKAGMPYPLLNTIKANIQTYISALPNTQFIIDSIKNNINTFFYAPWNPGPCTTNPCSNPAFYTGINISEVPITNAVPVLGNLSQQQLYTLLPAVLPAEEVAPLAPLLALAANTWSGQLAAVIGMLGGPVVQLGRSFNAIKTALAQGDTATALNQLINIPAFTTNAFLNGIGYVDLTDLVSKIQPLPPELKSIGLNMGGLVSPPVKYAGTLEDPTALSAGTLFDNVDTTAETKIPGLGTVTVHTPGQQVGFYSAAVGLGQYLATKMVVPPPPPTAALAAPSAAAVAAPAAAVAAPVVEAQVVADIAPTVETPAPQVVSAPSTRKNATAGGSDNSNNGGGRTQHSGSRGN